MTSTVLTGHSFTWPRTMVAVAVAILLTSACSNDSSPTASESTLAPSDDQTETSTIASSTSDGQPEDPTASAGCSLDDFRDGDTVKPASCGGSATVVLGGETIEFESFGCFTGEDAVEATRSDNTTFSSLGVVAHDGRLAAVVVSSQGSAVPIYDIAVVRDIASDRVWHGQANDGVVSIDGGRVTFVGDFAEASGGDTATGAIETGSIEAICAP